jgi:hypothetical protein
MPLLLLPPLLLLLLLLSRLLPPPLPLLLLGACRGSWLQWLQVLLLQYIWLSGVRAPCLNTTCAQAPHRHDRGACAGAREFAAGHTHTYRGYGCY